MDAIEFVRTLVAYECGATGPGKDCGYENPILKAITGMPMAMEGKTATCAHLSPLGNIAAATCDLWSNESVQHIKLLGGMAPTCMLESLVYDCRLLNRATADGPAARRQLRDWLSDSDAALDPQAYVLTPASAIVLAKAIVGADSHYHAGVAVARTAVGLLREGQRQGRVRIPANEATWLDTIEQGLDSLPEDEAAFIAAMMAEVDTSTFRAEDYDLA